MRLDTEGARAPEYLLAFKELILALPQGAVLASPGMQTAPPFDGAALR